MRKKGTDILKTYHEGLRASLPRPLYLEKGFTLKIGEVALKGRIDRMDAYEDGVEIIDYKTGKAKEKLDADDKEQLLLYQLACEQSLHLKARKLTFVYLENNTSVSFLGTPDDLMDLQERILDRVAALRENREHRQA